MIRLPIDLDIDFQCDFSEAFVFLTFHRILIVFRFASVCSKWRKFVKEDTKIRQRWKEFLGERKEYCALKGKVMSDAFS